MHKYKIKHCILLKTLKIIQMRTLSIPCHMLFQSTLGTSKINICKKVSTRELLLCYSMGYLHHALYPPSNRLSGPEHGARVVRKVVGRCDHRVHYARGGLSGPTQLVEQEHVLQVLEAITHLREGRASQGGSDMGTGDDILGYMLA